MAFKKAKTIESAQKLAAQGKLKEAVNEYLKLYKEDPQDQTVLNTLGDLHVRLNRTSEGLTYFTKLADLYVSGGFLVRGIAMFKKITKLDPNNTRAVERLAELYTMQGLMTEARAQYLHLAEFHLKSGQVSRAVEVMQKLLDLEPDNIKLQRRLAELYRQHGQNPEAAAIYRRLGTRALQRGEADDGLEWITQAVALVPEDPETLLLQARAQLKAGQAAEALATLEKIPGVEENPEAVEILVAAQLAAGHTEDATALAEKLFSAGSTQYGGLLQLAQHAVQQNQPEQALEILQRVAEPALQRDPISFLTAVRPVVSARPDSPEANQLLLEAGRKSSDQSACVEALNRMAQTALRAEDFPRAKDLYNELVRLEPDNLEFTQQLTQLREQLGEEPAIETPVAEELGVAAPAPAGTAPPAGELDEETQAFVDASLTDIDLFSSYGMTDKAIELAEQVIARAPGHTVANEKLLDFYLGNGNDRGVVEVATRLARLHRNHNNTEREEEVTELAKRYAEKLGMVLPTEAPVQQAAETPVETPEQTPEAVVQEVDLTAEWGSSLEEETATFNAAEAVEEISFFLKQGMVEEARSTVDGYERNFPNEPALADLRARIEAAAPAEAPQEEPTQEVAAAAPAEETTAPAQEAEEGYEVVLEEQPSEPEPAATGSMKAQDFFSDMATDIEQGLAQRKDLVSPGSATSTPAAESPASAPEPPPAPSTPETPLPAGPLADIFEEFKQELGDAEEEVEDIETHYNLGIAYKEMELFEEAIGEFQKATHAAEKRKAFPQLIQSCILLALCFRAKSMPKIAIRWYESSLKVPGLDAEGSLAIRYDLGEALEEAGDHKAALGCFMEVYGSNVDYRNVGERIRQLSAQAGS